MSTSEIESIKASLRRIEKAIIGDPDVGHKGLAGRVGDLEEKADKTDRKLIAWGSVAAGASIALTHLKTKLFGG